MRTRKTSEIYDFVKTAKQNHALFNDEEWVRLEHAQKEIKELNHLFDCFINHIPERQRKYDASIANFIFDIKKKFEEFLSERQKP